MPYKNREKQLQYFRDYTKNHIWQIKENKLKKDFGITLDEYSRMFSEQHGVCAVCLQPESTIHSGSKKVQSLSVDHNHNTNQVRGLLCSKCNTAIGLLDEDTLRMRFLIDYLESFR